ncbi:Imm1 family immunity protein [Actinokineospora sp. PR83]|uniref:Imm1 family immunity protein n=1 Tax=Actinokineospora sp. PR83 TaxID=2884908 RepID=UPI001EEBC251|nr:Imm1 family immunity protein [Actinokineospora sp. PR83]MCG8916195.1 Imm1 family immunity protein [Actinokineospora sp. PR83]
MIKALSGSFRTYGPDGPGSEYEVRADTRDAVVEFVARLGEPGADDAYLIHDGRALRRDLLEDEKAPDHALFLAIREDFGYLGYLGPVDGQLEDERMWPVGDPRSPGTHGTNNVDYPAGSGLPVAEVVKALDEFRVTGELPRSVSWTIGRA